MVEQASLMMTASVIQPLHEWPCWTG